MAMQKLKLISWNVNGLNSVIKRRHVFHWLGKQNCNVACIQESHIKKTETKYIKNKQLGEEFFSSTDKKRGTLIYAKKKN